MQSSPPAGIAADGTIRKLDPKVRTLWSVRRGVVPLVAGAVWFVVAVAAGDTTAAVLAGVVTVLVLVMVVASVALSYRYWTWSVHEDAIELTHGVVVRRHSVVPHHRIQQIDIERGPVERILGIATLVLRTAAATTDARIPGIGSEHSEQVRRALRERVGVDDAV